MGAFFNFLLSHILTSLFLNQLFYDDTTFTSVCSSISMQLTIFLFFFFYFFVSRISDLHLTDSLDSKRMYIDTQLWCRRRIFGILLDVKISSVMLWLGIVLKFSYWMWSSFVSRSFIYATNSSRINDIVFQKKLYF